MKKLLCFVAIISLCGLCVFAEETPKADVFMGYSFLRFNSAQTIPAFTMNGGIGTFAWNFGDHLGLEAELGGYHNGNVNNYQFDTTAFSFLFGPRLSYGRSKKFDPYIHTLFGGQHATTSIAQDSILVVNPQVVAAPSDGRYKASQTAFAMAIGGGLDIKVAKGIILRPVQIDYYLTRFEAPEVTVPTGSTVKTARNQNDFRFAAGVAFTFGAQ
jgi:opacity protein-like surface antigen